MAISICRNWSQGDCRFGERCRFRHDFKGKGHEKGKKNSDDRSNEQWFSKSKHMSKGNEKGKLRGSFRDIRHETQTHNETAIRAGYDRVAQDFNHDVEQRFLFREVQNHVTQDFIDAAIGGRKVDVLLDIACGKGGAMAKYLPFMRSEGTVVLADISPESIQEVKHRIKGKGLGQFVSKKIQWQPQIANVFSCSYWKQFPDDYADVVLCNFALHYAFENVLEACAVLKEISRVLKPGGIAIGITVDADMMRKAASSDSTLFRVTQFPEPPFKPGMSYMFELPGHVPPVFEYLIPMDALKQFGVEAGLVPYCKHSIFWSNLAHHADYDAAIRRIEQIPGQYEAADLQDAKAVCELYYTFMFKSGKVVHDRVEPVAVFTGSFDPIHLNHMGLCEHLIQKEGFKHVLVVPNGESPIKPWAAPYADRKRMAELAIKDADYDGICTVGERPGDDWKGRLELCHSFGRRHRGSTVFLVLGQDSFEKSLHRAGNSRTQYHGIFSIVRSGCKIAVLKRKIDTCEGDVRIPAPLARVVKVISCYEDPIKLSSTLVRTSVASDGDLTKLVSLSVVEYVRTHQLYQPRHNSHRIMIVLGSEEFSCAIARQFQQSYERLSMTSFDSSMQRLRASIHANRRYLIHGLATKDFAEFEKVVAQIDTIILGPESANLVHELNDEINEEILQRFISIGGTLIKCSENSLEDDIAGLIETERVVQATVPECHDIHN